MAFNVSITLDTRPRTPTYLVTYERESDPEVRFIRDGSSPQMAQGLAFAVIALLKTEEDEADASLCQT